jgi:biotin carboxyl carrier protein
MAVLSGAATAWLLLACAAPGSVLAGTPGGTQAPSAPAAGGTEYGLPARGPTPPRPVVVELSVPRTAPAGRPPRVTLRIDEQGASTVAVQVTVIDLAMRRRVIVVSLGWVRTGRVLTVGWPHGFALKAGSYKVSLSAHDRSAGTLLRSAHSSGQASLTIVSQAQAPAPQVSSPSTPTPPEALGVPTPAQSAASGAVFPVAGAHSFGGPENRFGAPRSGHLHQGQDVLTAEGTPIVAPLAGTILTTSYQAGGAGYYAVEHTAVGFDFLFAHCRAGSLAVGEGATVSAGQVLCSAGQTGDATTPHLHFEIWIGGWQSPSGHPIDPLPYLDAWDRPSGA